MQYLRSSAATENGHANTKHNYSSAHYYRTTKRGPSGASDFPQVQLLTQRKGAIQHAVRRTRYVSTHVMLIATVGSQDQAERLCTSSVD